MEAIRKITKYEKELENEGTQFFIIDTHGNKENGVNKYKEKDFKSYSWNKHQYNQVKEGDLFIYRRPQKSSEVTNQFYFFGAGKFGIIHEYEDGKLEADIQKPMIFNNYILKSDLEDADWSFKERKRKDWQHFFNQYGMNKITKKDFLMLLNLNQ